MAKRAKNTLDARKRQIAGLRRGGPGRPKGVTNKATQEIKAFSRDILSRPEYIASLQKRLDEGKAPHMETLLHHYGYGKPKETHEVSGPDGGPLETIRREIVRRGASATDSDR